MNKKKAERHMKKKNQEKSYKNDTLLIFAWVDTFFPGCEGVLWGGFVCVWVFFWLVGFFCICGGFLFVCLLGFFTEKAQIWIKSYIIN